MIIINSSLFSILGTFSPSLTLNTSEKKPEPIFSRLKSSRRARLDTALRRARYEDGLVRLVPWTLCSGGSGSPRSSSSSGSRLSACVSIADAAGGEQGWGGGGGGGGEGGGNGRTWNVRRSCKSSRASVDCAPCPLQGHGARGGRRKRVSQLPGPVSLWRESSAGSSNTLRSGCSENSGGGGGVASCRVAAHFARSSLWKCAGMQPLLPSSAAAAASLRISGFLKTLLLLLQWKKADTPLSLPTNGVAVCQCAGKPRWRRSL